MVKKQMPKKSCLENLSGEDREALIKQVEAKRMQECYDCYRKLEVIEKKGLPLYRNDEDSRAIQRGWNGFCRTLDTIFYYPYAGSPPKSLIEVDSHTGEVVYFHYDPKIIAQIDELYRASKTIGNDVLSLIKRG